MTSCASIWRTVRFGRRQTVTASLLLTLPMAEPPRSKRLKDGPRRDGLHVLTGPESLLTFHLRDALDRTTNGFPEECWFVEENRLLKLGRDYGMAEVHSLDEASAAGNHILEIWNAIPTWSEVKTRSSGASANSRSIRRTQRARSRANAAHEPAGPLSHLSAGASARLVGANGESGQGSSNGASS